MFRQPCPMYSMNPYAPMNNPYMTNPHMFMMDPYHYLMAIRPLVDYGIKEAEYTSKRHAMTEIALIAYLMGMGYDMHRARGIVESWEIDEKFPYEDR